MKKLTALIMAALILTIGGVYATWQYAQGSIQSKVAYVNGQQLNMEVNKDATAGHFAVSTTGVSILVDDNNNDYVAELEFSGAITINFTPETGSSHTEGAIMEYQVSITDTSVTYKTASEVGGKYVVGNSEAQILKIDDAKTGWITLNGGVATKEATILAADLGLQLGGTFYLPTYEDFSVFRDKLKSLSIKIEVREKAAVAGN